MAAKRDIEIYLQQVNEQKNLQIHVHNFSQRANII